MLMKGRIIILNNKEQIYKKQEKLYIYEYQNAIILPRKYEDDGPTWGKGGVCSQEGEFVQSSFYDRGWAQNGGKYEWNQTDEIYIDEKVIYIGVFAKHWGHFLVDMTSKLWIFADSEFKENIKDFKVAYIGEEEPEGNYLEFYKILGIGEEQLIHIEKPARFQKVFVPEAGFRPCIWYTEEYQRMFDLMTESVLKDKTLKEKFKNIKKIYFSRRKFGKAVATEFGEEYIEQCFNQNGYESLGPETLTLREQIYVWNHAEAIACMNGTIPLNVVFCKNEKLKLTILNKMSIYHKNPYIYLYMRNIQAEFIDIYKEPLKGYPKSLGEGPYLIKTGKEFFHYCQREKFEIPYTGMKLKFYDLKQEIRYYLCVIGIGNKIRRVGSYIKRKMLRR